MKVLKKIYFWFIEIQSWIALALLGATIVLNACEILQRNLFGKSFYWLQEYSTLMLLWFAMLGMSKIVYDHEDIYVDLFVSKFPAKLKKVVQSVILVIIILFLIVAVRETWGLFLSQKGTRTIIAQYPLQLRSVAILLGMSSMLIENVVMLVQRLKAPAESGDQEVLAR